MKIKGLLKGAMADRNIRPDDLAPAIHMSVPTFYLRLKNPNDFRMREIKAISRVLKIPVDTIIEAIG